MDAEVSVVPVTIPAIDTAPAAVEVSRLAGGSERRTLIALGCGTFVGALVFVIPPLFFPQMSRDLQVSVPLLGQIMSAMLLLSVALGLIVGPLSDSRGFRLLIVTGLLAATACLLVIGLAPAFPLLLLASLAGAVADAGVVGSSFAIAGTAFSGAAARRAIGWTSAAQAGSAIVGVPLLAAIGATAGWRVAFMVAALAALAVVGLAALWLPRDTHRAREPLRLGAILAPYPPLLRDGTMRRLFGATMLGAVCWFGLVTYLGAYLVDVLGLGPGHVGLVYMVVGFGYAAGSLAVGGPLAAVPSRRLAALGFLANAMLIALAFSTRVDPPVSAAWISAAALAAGMQGAAMTALLAAETPSGAGTTMTLNVSLFNLGAAGGSAIGGALLALSGYEALAIGLPVFGVAAALLSSRPPRA